MIMIVIMIMIMIMMMMIIIIVIIPSGINKHEVQQIPLELVNCLPYM